MASESMREASSHTVSTSMPTPQPPPLSLPATSETLTSNRVSDDFTTFKICVIVTNVPVTSETLVTNRVYVSDYFTPF